MTTRKVNRREIGVWIAIAAFLPASAQAAGEMTADDLLFQVFLALVAGTGVAARLYWVQIRTYFGYPPKPERVRVEPQ